MHPVPGRMRTLCAEKIAAKKSVFERLFFSARFRKRENAHMETAHMFLYATDFFARENAAKIAYMEKRPYSDMSTLCAESNI